MTTVKKCECGKDATYFNSPLNGRNMKRGFCDSCYQDRCRRASNARLDKIQMFKNHNKPKGDLDDENR